MSCADVCLSGYDGDIAEFFTSKMVRARKPHVCCECRRPIAVGNMYERAAGKCDGEMFSRRTCAICAEIFSAFACGTLAIGEMWENMRYEMFPVWRQRGPWDCLAKLTSEEAVAECTRHYKEWLHDNEYDDLAPEPAHE